MVADFVRTESGTYTRYRMSVRLRRPIVFKLAVLVYKSLNGLLSAQSAWIV